MPPIEPFLCEHCLTNNELRTEVEGRGVPVETCPTCHRAGGRALPADDPMAQRIFRALVRLHFSEWHYNEHIGGDSLEMLVFSSKSIFNLDENASLIDFEQSFLALTDKDWYPETDEGIALGGGYWNGSILDGLRTRRDHAVEDLVSKALVRNWFEVEPAVRSLLGPLRADLSMALKVGAEFTRARIGVHSRVKRAHFSPQAGEQFSYLPHTDKDIGRPPLSVAAEGRFNRTRVSILYLASDVATAVAELRPHPGHLVSTATFRLKRDLCVANFANQDIRNFLSDQRLEDLRRILSIQDVLCVPVQPEHRTLYGVTQLFADALRAEGFDGLVFKSSVGNGENITCFDGNAFELVAGSEAVVEVAALQYRLVEMPVVLHDYSRQDFTETTDSPMSILLHGMARQDSRQ